MSNRTRRLWSAPSVIARKADDCIGNVGRRPWASPKVRRLDAAHVRGGSYPNATEGGHMTAPLGFYLASDIRTAYPGVAPGS